MAQNERLCRQLFPLRLSTFSLQASESFAAHRRATRMAVRKAVENASSELDLEDTHEANISLALAAARIHKRRNAVACPDESDRPIIAQVRVLATAVCQN